MKFVIWGSIIAILFCPFILNIIANNVEITSQAEFGSWLGFLGSYIGGIISGGITLGGVLLGFKWERKKNIAHRYLTVATEMEALSEGIEQTVESILNYKKLLKEGTITENPYLNTMDRDIDKYRKLESSCGSVDIQLFNEIKEFKGYLFNLKFEILMATYDDADISASGEKNFNEDYESLKKSKDKIRTTIERLRSISEKYQ